jgi:hypothetical protein
MRLSTFSFALEELKLQRGVGCAHELKLPCSMR